MGPRLAGQSVTVVGGGIGGLAAATALAQMGAGQVTLLEQASGLREAGAGIQITPNGARVIRALGLFGAFEAQSLAARAVVPTDALTGRPVARFPLSDSGGYRLIARPALLSLLANGAREAGVQIRTGAGVTGLDETGAARVAGETVQSDWVIGADGVHSVVRRAIDGAAPEPRFTGQVAWRAMAPDPGHPPEPRIWMAPGRHVVTYPLADGQLNIVAVEERQAWAAEGWAHKDDPASLKAAFSGACSELEALLARVEQVNLWGLFRHPVAGSWYKGKIAILGDAAHPTLPFLAQGANLALEDALILARCLSELDPGAALPSYQALRRDRAARAIAAANANARNYHLSGIPRRIAHLGLGMLGRVAPARFMARYDWLYGYDPASVSLAPRK